MNCRAPDVTDLLPQPHHLEALEVGELPPLGGLGPALRPGAVVPLLLNLGLLPSGLDGTVAGSAGNLLDNKWRERDVGEGNGVARDDRLRRR